SNTEYQFMTGGQFVAHPGNSDMTYRVTVRDPFHEIMDGVESFEYSSEQYYMHVDPAINVLATTVFDGSIRRETEGVQMPVVWTKHWGEGRVFFSALGHVAKEFEHAMMLRVVINGFKWAAK
ncbi:MAG: ThuA domain-containing protein, partial [Verrucomicrobiota bacterium]